MFAEALPGAPDRVTALVERSLNQSRLAREVIHETVLPALPPARRLGAERLLRGLDSKMSLREALLEELAALIRLVESEIAAGSQDVFRSSECDPSHGHVETLRDDRAEALAGALPILRDLRAAMADALDAVEALRLTGRIIGSE